MFSNTIDSRSEKEIEVLLDGLPVRVPSGRRSPSAIRCYLDTLALARQRILHSFTIDGQPADPGRPLATDGTFRRVEGETFELEQLPLQLIKSAKQQCADARKSLESAIVVVLINYSDVARECWWDLARKLKEPLLTLSLLPEDLRGGSNSVVSFAQLRRWQLEQLADILKDVDKACWSEDTRVLSNVLENRVVPWLNSLSDSLSLLHDTLCAGVVAAKERCCPG
jgi:hypothetical protein